MSLYKNKVKSQTSFFTIILIAILLFFFCKTTFAEEPTLLKQGQPAPYAGILLDDRLELKARTAILENEKYKDIVVDQYEMINTIHQRNVLKDEQITILKKQIQNQDGITIEKILWFIGGALVGGVAVQYGK